MTELVEKDFPKSVFGLMRMPRVLILLRILRYFSLQFESGTLTTIVV